MADTVTERAETEHMSSEEQEIENSLASRHLLFTLGDEFYGLAIGCVTEIIEVQQITVLPEMPDFIKGVIKLRERIIPVMDLRIRFNIPGREYDGRTCIIVASVGGTATGFIVDTVAEVRDILADEIEHPPTLETDTERNSFIAGLGKIDEGVAILIDVNKLLHERELEAIERNIEEGV